MKRRQSPSLVISSSTAGSACSADPAVSFQRNDPSPHSARAHFVASEGRAITVRGERIRCGGASDLETAVARMSDPQVLWPRNPRRL